MLAFFSAPAHSAAGLNLALILRDENECDSYEYSDATKHAQLGEMVFGRSNSR